MIAKFNWVSNASVENGFVVENTPANSNKKTIVDIFSTSDNHRTAQVQEYSNQDNEKISKYQRETLGGITSRFMDSTSAHGFIQVKQRKRLITKIFWITILLAAFIGLGLHLSLLVIKYLDFEHEETTELLTESPSFPDVTICNMDPLSSDRYYSAQPNISDYWKLINNWDNITQTAKRKGVETFSNQYILGMPGIFANWPKNMRRLVSYQYHDLFVTCTYNEESCNQSNFKIYEHSEFFNCFTFQQNSSKFIRAGPERGLTFLLYIGDQVDVRDKPFSAFSPVLGSRGWRIAIHEHNTLPSVFEDGIDILPGRSTSLAISSTKISRLPSPYTDCVQDSLLPATEYTMTQSACRKQCMRSAIEINCGCVPAEITPYHYPDDHYCLTYNLKNMTKVFEQVQCENKIKHDQYGKDTTDGIKRCEEKCQLRCEEIDYNMQITTSVFPTPEVMSFFYTLYVYENPNRGKLLAWKHFNDPKRHIKAENKTPEDYLFKPRLQQIESVMTPGVTSWIADSFARVNIYFNDVTVLRKKQSASYKIGDLFADIGGVLGLWVGVSVITIFEFLTLLSELAFLSCKLEI